MTALVRLIESLTVAVGWLGALLIVPLVLATCWEVGARYAFGAPTIWAFELGYMLMGAHFLLGGALAMRAEAHVRVDLLYGRFTPRVRAAIDGVLYTVLLVCVVLVSLRLHTYTMGAFVSGEGSGQSAWNPPVWPFRAVIALSFAVLTLQIVAEIMKCMQVVAGGRNLRTRDNAP
jgi:TRAP-type mannitol/chloroaromatic compound transport system permease small subunit